jgi:tetratricopeptide (TPR) repeat protein
MKVLANITKLNIPTYELGKPEINPVFFEKRVYQGSSGKVYPVPFIDKVHDHKVDKDYVAAILENDYVRLVMLPEIGGRIFEAQDKANNDYNFFYKQDVIKPALVGLAGPWISGGVEFNWPQHHRPGTYLPTDVFLEDEGGGVKTLWMSEYDPMSRLKGMHGIRLRPDSALIELRGRLYNRTPILQSFLWWANVAVEVHERYQSFFPPDVHYVADHAVRAMSSFPLAQNDYYGIPYHKRPGNNDLRKYQNISVPTSFMVCETHFDFFGGYDFKANGGFVHVANRHIAPGKKQWTWGNEAFGKAWDRELTDAGGPYFELMAGVYTDNQPDFAYLAPFETKTFSQFWWSYKKLGPVQNANADAAVRLIPEADNRLSVGLATSAIQTQLRIVLKVGQRIRQFSPVDCSPENPWQINDSFCSGEEQALEISVFTKSGSLLIAYCHKEVDSVRNRNVAFEPPHPKAVKNAAELSIIGEHLELYRHPTRYPESYWEEAIRKDPNQYNAHISLAKGAIKAANFSMAQGHLEKAVEILTTYHPNPSTGEAHYYLGLVHFYQEAYADAYPLLYKATWSYAWRAAGYYLLAKLDIRNKDYQTALNHVNEALVTNAYNNSAHILKAITLTEMGESQAGVKVLKDLLLRDPLDQWANFELGLIDGDLQKFFASSRNDAQTTIDIALEYIEIGMHERAIRLLEAHHAQPVPTCAVPNPMGCSAMTHLLLACLYAWQGKNARSQAEFRQLRPNAFDYFFPSRIQEVVILEKLLAQQPDFLLAAYGLGNFYFNAKRHTDAIEVWRKAARKQCGYATLYRNLGIAYWNAYHDGDRARAYFEKAVALSPRDMRIQFEYDQLRKKLNDDPEQRLADVLALGHDVTLRDDFCIELCALYNLNGQYCEVLKLLTQRPFHPWEGGEGQVLKQYSHACLKLGQNALAANDAMLALTYFERAIDTPDSLGEKYHPLQAVAHINYWKGVAYRALGQEDKALKHFVASAEEDGDFIEMAVSNFSELTYYKILSMNELGHKEQAMALCHDMETFAQQKLQTEAKIDYFATSLPLLLVFDDDIQQANQVEGYYLLGLAKLAAEELEEAETSFLNVLNSNNSHPGATEHLRMLRIHFVEQAK